MNPRLRTFLVRTALLAATYVIVLVLIETGIINAYLQATMVTICVNIMLAVSLNLVTGFTGQFSLGHAGFMAIGAYSTALITMSIPTVWGFVLGLVTGAVLAALLGFLVGLPTLRLRGDYLAIATLGMAEIIRVLLLNMGFTNGAAGLSGIPQFVNWNWLFVLTVGTVVLISNFLNSRFGHDCIAVREDEIAAESIGVRSTRVKTLAFMTGAFFGAIAGGVYASYFYFLKPDLFGFMQSINILVIVVLGGLGSVSGSIIAAVLLAVISTLLQPFPEIRMILYSLALVVLMVFRPQGIMGSRELSLQLFSRLLPKRHTKTEAREGAIA
ncbi:MAG: branched-chain amino acid ABC transporter permease [Propionibacterium sp.]|nr:branched-chain amino acid ABC transporter permease [Propionibacterium sp.]